LELKGSMAANLPIATPNIIADGLVSCTHLIGSVFIEQMTHFVNYIKGGIQTLNWISKKVEDLLSRSLSITLIPLLGFNGIHLGANLFELRSPLGPGGLASGKALISNCDGIIAIFIRGLIEIMIH
jgi:hypothetical protein